LGSFTDIRAMIAALRVQQRTEEGLMDVLQVFDPGRQTCFGDLQTRLIGYASRVEELRSPDEILNELHTITTRHLPLSVLGAARFPLKSGDWESVQIGKSAFLHTDVPKGWWEEYEALARGRFRPIVFFAESSMAPFTWTELRRLYQPIGIDKWPYDLAFKHGIRDGLNCPVGGRWLVAFWSRKDISNVVTRQMRILIHAAASFAALRLDQLVNPDPNIVGSRVRLTPRELAVLRLVSKGAQSSEVAQALNLGEETVRSHLKKAQSKLGVRNRTEAVAEALRQHLIP
jgi:LuxR family quorum sensing-dependent transcriptional regulator